VRIIDDMTVGGLKVRFTIHQSAVLVKNGEKIRKSGEETTKKPGHAGLQLSKEC
jgi:hypothetical protein